MPVYQRPLRSDELMHYGVKGQKWGQRRYQNEDGSYTSAGAVHYGRGLGDRMRRNSAGFMRRDAAKSMAKARNYSKGSLRRRYYEANANMALKDARRTEDKQRSINANRQRRANPYNSIANAKRSMKRASVGYGLSAATGVAGYALGKYGKNPKSKALARGLGTASAISGLYGAANQIAGGAHLISAGNKFRKKQKKRR